MPVGLLSDDQVRAYTAFEELPSLSDLEKFFFLDAFDRDVIAKSRQDSHRLGGSGSDWDGPVQGPVPERSAGGAVAGGGLPG
ncbi:DUF4158 domain-containing protein [Nonomuraea sp. NPDC050786]|uniref:DUF4158 domain-containing protein n=1 Tax=Nonomuraea sp. NPDC050786 TaxID=3154840 RepID=UPI00340A50F6